MQELVDLKQAPGAMSVFNIETVGDIAVNNGYRHTTLSDLEGQQETAIRDRYFVFGGPSLLISVVEINQPGNDENTDADGTEGTANNITTAGFSHARTSSIPKFSQMSLVADPN
jgi:hypothetical protein